MLKNYFGKLFFPCLHRSQYNHRFKIVAATISLGEGRASERERVHIPATSAIKSASPDKQHRNATLDCCCTSGAVAGVCRKLR